MEQPSSNALPIESLPSERRACSAARTAARVLELAPLLGITRVANVTGLDTIGIPVVMVVRPNSRSISVSQGKGYDLDAARASGLMEALELYHAERALLPLRLGSWRELSAAGRTVEMEGLPIHTATLYDDDRPLLWAEGTNLLDGERRWVPYELVHTNFTLPLPTGSGCFVMSSNGLASGNTKREAVVHALCEVIERDATTLWHLRGAEEKALTRIGLESVTDPYCRALLDKFRAANVAVAVWDVTSDVGIPTFRCVAADDGRDRFLPIPPVEGMGCHLVREVALLRALTEAAQVRLTAIAGTRDDNDRASYEAAQRSKEMLYQSAPARDLASVPTYVEETEDDELARLVQRLHSVGVQEIVATELTDARVRVPVVRVVVPYLEPYHHVRGYVPGRRARRLTDARREEAER